MNQFIEAVEAAVAQQNYYGALLLTVTLPDIAGALMMPDQPNAGPRYKAWWARYLEPTYTSRGHIFLGPSDAWALRCALLHAGSDVIEGQKAAEALDRFRFIQPPKGSVHLNQSDRTLFLQVDRFAADVVAGVRAFLADVEDDAVTQEAMADLATIRFPKIGDRFVL